MGRWRWWEPRLVWNDIPHFFLLKGGSQRLRVCLYLSDAALSELQACFQKRLHPGDMWLSNTGHRHHACKQKSTVCWSSYWENWGQTSIAHAVHGSTELQISCIFVSTEQQFTFFTPLGFSTFSCWKFGGMVICCSWSNKLPPQIAIPKALATCM